MKFSVYQVSRKGGRERTKTAWAIATRGLGPVRAGRRHGWHPKARWPRRSALQTLAALFQRESQAALADPLRFLHDPIIAATTSCCAMRRAQPDRHAAHHHRGLRAAGNRPTGRTAATRACTWCAAVADRPHATIPTRGAAGDHVAGVVPMGERFNRNILFTCLGSPPPNRWSTPPAGGAAAGRPPAAVLRRRPVGHALATPTSSASSRTPRSDAVPELVEQALRTAGVSDNVTVLARRWESAEDADAAPRRRPRNDPGRRRVRLHHPGQRAGRRLADELDDAEIESARSARSTRRSAPLAGPEESLRPSSAAATIAT